MGCFLIYRIMYYYKRIDGYRPKFQLLLSILAFYIPLFNKSDTHLLVHVTMFFLLFIVSVSCYGMLRVIFIELYKTKMDVINPYHLSVSTSIWKLFIICFFVAAIQFVIIQLCQIKLRAHFILTAMVSMISVIPASLISLDFLRLTGFVQGYSFMYSAQLGIPHFWAPILMGFLSTFFLRANKLT